MSSLRTLKANIEAILFSAESPLEAGEIRALLEDVSLADVRMALRSLAKDYADRAFELVEQENRYQLKTRAEFLPILKKQHAAKARALSKSALETLAIIAYRQPVTRAQISALRQIDSASIVQSLKEKDLIFASGTRKEAGNPIEYKTTEKFLEIFGLSSLKDLPSLRSLQISPENQQQVAQALKVLDEKKQNKEESLEKNEGILGFMAKSHF